MMCQRMGRPPISTRGFGRISVCSDSLVPIPPHKMTTGISWLDIGTILRARFGEILPIPTHRRLETAVEGIKRRPVELLPCLAGIQILKANFVEHGLVAHVRRER